MVMNLTKNIVWNGYNIHKLFTIPVCHYSFSTSCNFQQSRYNWAKKVKINFPELYSKSRLFSYFLKNLSRFLPFYLKPDKLASCKKILLVSLFCSVL